MNQDLRERAILPVLIPIAAIVVTEIVVFAMSRVLLTAGTQGAVVIAIGSTVAIMVGAVVIASARRIRTATIAGLLSVALVIVVAAGAVSMQRGSAIEKELAAHRPTLEVSAADLAFDTETLALAPGGTVIDFANADSQPHNIAVYPDESSLNEPLFKGQIIQAGQSVTYEVPAIPAGEYYFHCDVHPTMKGTAEVSDEAASGAAEEGEH